MRHLINIFCRPGTNSSVLSLGSGSGTDAIAAAQVGRSSVSLGRDPIQYVRSVARAQAALVHHEEKIATMTELEISLVSGRLYFEAPPPHTRSSFIWTVPLAQSQSNESTDTQSRRRRRPPEKSLDLRSKERMCSECGAKVGLHSSCVLGCTASG